MNLIFHANFLQLNVKIVSIFWTFFKITTNNVMDYYNLMIITFGMIINTKVSEDEIETT